jgi:hypothetical protein
LAWYSFGLAIGSPSTEPLRRNYRIDARWRTADPPKG